MPSQNVVIIGAGPAGLAAAHTCLAYGYKPIVLEQTQALGGIARTELHNGYRFDIGGHRFFTTNEAIGTLWRNILGQDLIKVKRTSRIIHNGRFYDYPLRLRNTCYTLGFKESWLILFSYLKAQMTRASEENSLEQWMTNRFGRRLYETFFEKYTEKVWGLPGHQIQSDWAAQRIKNLSLATALSNALLGTNKAKSLIDEFYYPVLGPGMMWQRLKDLIEAKGGIFLFNTKATGLKTKGRHVTSVVCNCDGKMIELPATYVISSMPVAALPRIIDPEAPPGVLNDARRLKYRALIMVGLIVNRKNLFRDQWLYVHSPDVRVGRIQNFKNWSAAMVPDADKTSIGLEYFCNPQDRMWQTADDSLVGLASVEIEKLGLAPKRAIVDAVVFRQKGAYPIYDRNYYGSLQTLRFYLDQYENLQSIGRNGMHRYNNMDHSMLTGLLAVQKIRGIDHDLWAINEEHNYLEKGSTIGAQPLFANTNVADRLRPAI